MSKYYKIGKFTNDLFTVNLPTEITPEQFHEECRKMEDKAKKKIYILLLGGFRKLI